MSIYINMNMLRVFFLACTEQNGIL